MNNSVSHQRALGLIMAAFMLALLLLSADLSTPDAIGANATLTGLLA